MDGAHVQQALGTTRGLPGVSERADGPRLRPPRPMFGDTWYNPYVPSTKGAFMAVPAEFPGLDEWPDMSVPAAVRHRWGLDHGGR